MTRYAILLAAALVAAPAFASDAFDDRRVVLDKYRQTSPLVIGVFPGTVGGDLTNTHTLLRRYLPFSNYLSNETKRIVSFLPQLNVQQFKQEVADKKFHAVYVNAEIGVSAVLAGYVPVARREEDIVSVFMVLADSPLANIKDVADKRVGLVDQAMVSTLAKYSMIEAGVYSSVKLSDAGSTGQDGLMNFLDNKTVEAVIVRKETAEQLIAKTPNKYKVAVIADKAPGFILMVDPQRTTEREREALAGALLRLDGRRAADLAVISGLDGRIGTYTSASPRDMEHMVRVLEKLTEVSGNRGLISRKATAKPASVSAAPPGLPPLPAAVAKGS